MGEISTADIERLGMLADEADNYWHAAQLPLPPHVHVAQLTNALYTLAQRLKDVYRILSGDNPWADSPCTHCRSEEVPHG